jgi:hypothetical protein
MGPGILAKSDRFKGDVDLVFIAKYERWVTLPACRPIIRPCFGDSQSGKGTVDQEHLAKGIILV